MNYQDQNTTHALAAEYVLGTLRGSARKRFRQLIVQHSSIQKAVIQWESYFNNLSLRLEPVAPDPAVWQKIQSRLDESTVQELAIDNVIRLPKQTNTFWKSVTAFASAAAIILAVILVVPSEKVVDSPLQFTVVQNEQSQPLWLIEVLQQTIEAQATKNVQQQANNDYELWMVPEDGSAPVSLGLLPQTGKTTINKHPLFEQTDIAALAVSKEPLGGSPNGTPTDVLFVANLAIL